jgi:hypothetical protein
MKQKKVISLPTNEGKIYRQILAFMNFMLNLTPQERDVLAEVIKLDNEYEALPPEKRGKFILSTDMRKEIRDSLNIEEKQFNVILSRLKSPKKSFMGKPLIDDNNIIHSELKFKPDQDGFKFEVNFVMTTLSTPAPVAKQFTEELEEEMVEQRQEEANFVEEQLWASEPITAPTEYKYDAAKAPVLEEEEFNISITPPNE